MSKKENHVWLHFSDLMTGLMVIFLFVAISYLRKVNNSINVITEYVDTKQKIYEELNTKFHGEVELWDMTIGKDLSIRFNNAQVNFQIGSAELTSEFKSRLDEFIPRYFNILLSDSIRGNITEIRIEGHTDPNPISNEENAFMDNLALSQNRARNVMKHIREMSYYKDSLTQAQRDLLQFWICSTGFSFSRTLDSNREFTYDNGTNPDNEASRRVEFRILTNGEKAVERFIKLLPQN